MKAIQVQKTGGPEVLTLVDLPVPEPKPNEALVKVSAAGVNFIDIYFRQGQYPAPLPFVDGHPQITVDRPSLGSLLGGKLLPGAADRRGIISSCPLIVSQELSTRPQTCANEPTGRIQARI